MLKGLAVIPARGGSKGIFRKNMRLLNGKPLIHYSLNTAQQCNYIVDIVVTSDDEQILSYVSRYGVTVRHRPSDLAADDVPLDPVIKDALDYVVSTKNQSYDFVVTLQPTSPLLSIHTLNCAIEEFSSRSVDTLLSVVDDSCLTWNEVGSEIVPGYKERLNRQWLPKRYRETGAFLITRPQYVCSQSRFGKSVSVFVMPEHEGIDVDSVTDWLISDALIRRLHYAFVVNGSSSVGFGHIYRSLVLADTLLGHEVSFYACDSDEAAIDLIRRRGYQCNIIDEVEIPKVIARSDCQIVINDILDTKPSYIRALKDSGKFVVSFEDLGEGSDYADIVFNALYECTSPPENRRFGHMYVCLSHDFLMEEPIRFRTLARNLLITFGGVDQNNLTSVILNLVPHMLNKTTLREVSVVIGPGFGHEKELIKTLRSLPDDVLSHIEILKSVDNMAALMGRIDLAITSNGRTIYELAAMGVPTISISQNDRETMHLFTRYNRGIRYMGTAWSCTPEKLLSAIVEIANDEVLRSEMYQAQVATDLRKGLFRVVREIEREYWRWKDA